MTKSTCFIIKFQFALGIEAEILFVRNEQKDCNKKPDPQGNAKKKLKESKKIKLLYLKFPIPSLNQARYSSTSGL